MKIPSSRECMMRKILFFLLLLPSLLFAQKDLDMKLKLADEFFQNKEFDKSIELYEDVFKKRREKDIYLSLVNAYLAEKRYDDAEKIVKKQLKLSPNDPVYRVDQGYILKTAGDVRKGENLYNDAIKEMPVNTNAVLALSTSFQRRNEIHFAIKCLERGKKITGKYYGYEFELGELYYQTGNIEAMVNEYLDLLEKNEGYIQNVQNALNTSIYHDVKKEDIGLLNEALIKRIQRNPDKIIFSELLIWHYLQQKDFKGAISQSKALDRRNKESGYRFISLGKTCRSNREYDLAMECYQYIIDKGPSSPNYINARILMTETIREKITSGPYSNDDLLTMEQNYLETMADIGKTSATVSLQIGLAEVWGFYMNKTDEAVDILDNALQFNDISDIDKAKCKLVLADIYVIIGEIWEASLLYSQVEKDFKYDALGDKAKYKNAKVYFYTGDFGWAKAQLDVLKGSTSKLISNDAMQLSLLISDNLAFDTSGEALQIYANAALFFEQNQTSKALSILDSMENIYMIHSIIDEVYYLKYQIYFKNQDYNKAANSLQKIVDDFSYDILGDEAAFKLAELEENYLNNSAKAKDLYQTVFTKYPGSVYVVEARNRFRKMRGDDIN